MSSSEGFVTTTWRGYTLSSIQYKNPFSVKSPIETQSEAETEDEIEYDECDLVLNEEWRERLSASHSRMRQKLKRQKRVTAKLSTQEKIERLADELQHGYENAMKRYYAQQDSDAELKLASMLPERGSLQGRNKLLTTVTGRANSKTQDVRANLSVDDDTH